MVLATCRRTQQSSKGWLPCLLPNLDFVSSTFPPPPGTSLCGSPLVRAQPHLLRASHCPLAPRMGIPAGLPALSAGPRKAAQRPLQGFPATQAVLKEAASQGGKEGGTGGCSCSYPLDGDVHLSDGCWHLGKEQGPGGQGVREPSMHSRFQPPLAPGWGPPISQGQCMPWQLRPGSHSQRSGYKKGPLTLAGLQAGGLAKSSRL